MYVSLDSKIRVTELKEISKEKTHRFIVRLSDDLGYAEDVTVIIQKYHSSAKEEFELKYTSTKNGISTFISDFIHFNLGSGLYFYCFKVCLSGKIYYLKTNYEEGLSLTTLDLPWMQFTVTDKVVIVPEWAKGSIMFHIMVDRFARDVSVPVFNMSRRTIHQNWNDLPDWMPNEKGEITNTDFFCGNLKGITKHLKYIKKLGVKIIYLSPICRSQSNHRYDTADYLSIDPYLGSADDMKELCKKAHALNMKVIVDTVFNHTGDDSIYFNRLSTFPEKGAISGKDSKYFEWYKRDCFNNFQYWWNFGNLPVCNPDCKSWQDFLFSKNGVIDTWFTKWGIDGLRLDVADELPDYFLTMLADSVKKYKNDAFILGEVWENAIRKNDGNRNYLLGSSLHSVMNYPFSNAILKYIRFKDEYYLRNTINEICADYPQETLLSAMNSLSTHDIPRAITTLVGNGFVHNAYEWTWDIGNKDRNWQNENDSSFSHADYKKGRKLLKAAVSILYFLPGNPCIFYGDEVGLYGYKDPWNRKTYPWGHRDKKLMKYYRTLGKVHNMLPLSNASFSFINVTKDIVMYERTWKDKRILIAVNITEKTQSITIPEQYNNDPVIFETNHSTSEQLAPYGLTIISNCNLEL